MKIEALTRREIEEIAKKGFEVNTVSIADVKPGQWDNFIDELVRTYAPNKAELIDKLKDLPNTEYRKICLELIAETWGSLEEEKNS